MTLGDVGMCNWSWGEDLKDGVGWLAGRVREVRGPCEQGCCVLHAVVCSPDRGPWELPWGGGVVGGVGILCLGVIG